MISIERYVPHVSFVVNPLIRDMDVRAQHVQHLGNIPCVECMSHICQISVPRGRVPQGRVHAPLTPHAPRTGSLLGVCFPTHLLGSLGETQGGAFPQYGGQDSPKGVRLGISPQSFSIKYIVYSNILVCFAFNLDSRTMNDNLILKSMQIVE